MFFTRVFICCPANVTTGGPELLHQFAAKLHENGVESYIVYYPFESIATTPEQYKDYNVKVATADEIDDKSLIVLPETATKFSRIFCQKNVAIWWLSVDNYYGYSSQNNAIEKLKHLARLVCKKKKSIKAMKNFIHLHQSEYARLKLLNNGINSMQMTDYLNVTHLDASEGVNLSEKEKLIAYNPKKGYETTQLLIKKFPSYNFIPLVNMSPAQVKDTLKKAMIYIDFGNHPGKDRLPREAALANCCIITGRRGSACNNVDVPIPERFKIAEKTVGFEMLFKNLCDSIFENFIEEWLLFSEYRKSIYNEAACFDNNVDDFILKYIVKNDS